MTACQDALQRVAFVMVSGTVVKEGAWRFVNHSAGAMW
jgi:hypothetical protein